MLNNDSNESGKKGSYSQKKDFARAVHFFVEELRARSAPAEHHG